MDLKTPGSGEVHRMEWRNLDLLKEKDEVKFVIADRRDFEWSLSLVRERNLDAGRVALVTCDLDAVVAARTAVAAVGERRLRRGQDDRRQQCCTEQFSPHSPKGTCCRELSAVSERQQHR
jgi:hypothetical protein